MLNSNDKHELKIRSLHPLIGAEVTNVDLRNPCNHRLPSKYIRLGWTIKY